MGTYRFGAFRVDSVKRLLFREGQPVALTSKAFDTLLALLEHRDHVVEKDDLMRLVWPETVVEESNLSQNVFTLRKALGEHPQEHRYITTIPAARLPVRGRACGSRRPRSGGPRGRRLPPAVAGGAAVHLARADADEYLGLGMADALITRLGNIRRILVRPTSAVRA